MADADSAGQTGTSQAGASRAKLSLGETLRTMDALTRFRYISVAVQYALIVLAVIGYVLYSNGGSPVLTQVAVVGIIVCLFSRLAVTLVVALRRRNHG